MKPRLMNSQEGNELHTSFRSSKEYSLRINGVKTLVFLVAIVFSSGNLNAQADSAMAASRALLFADSMLKSFRNNNIDQYAEMSYPGVIKYYGGIKNYQEYVRRARLINNSIDEGEKESTHLVQIQNEAKEWQCVVQKTRESLIDGKKAAIISYMVGQSTDEGMNWKFFDVAFNSVENVIYIMPDIFETLSIPQRQIVFGKNGIAKKE